ncbi:MAG: MBL fold metallo-hydrolase, partial [Thermodesulfobacteriota bacterium]
MKGNIIVLIRCWGSRGSISVSGKDFLKYGGDTTCLEVVSNENDLVILDAGTGIRVLGNRLVADNDKRVINILLTHAHWDHLAGFPFFKPIYMKDTRIRIFGPLSTQESLRSIISKTMSHPYFPIEFEDISAEITFHEMDHSAVEIGALKVDAIPLSHPNQGFGYKFSEDGKSFVFITDNELTHEHVGGKEFDDYVEFAKDADLLIHDAEYTREEYAHTKGWGHSVYLDTLDLALKANVKKFGLFHLNQDRTDEEEDKLVEDCKRIINENGSKLDCFAVATG